MPAFHGVIGHDGALAGRARRAITAHCESTEASRDEEALLGASPANSPCDQLLWCVGNAVTAADGISVDVAAVRSLAATPASAIVANAAGLEQLAPAFALGLYDSDTARGLLYSSSSGIFPIFYVVDGGTLAFSTRQGHLAKAAQCEPDIVGAMEFLRYGYTVHNRTLFKGMKRLLPGQALTFDPADGRAVLNEHSGNWVGIAGDTADAVDESVVWRELLEDVSRQTSGFAQHRLMFSGGWDSRTLLALTLASSPASRLGCYTHGDGEAREVKLARLVAASRSVPFRSRSLTDISLEPDALARYHERTENVVFPHWHKAGENIRTECGDDVVVSAGIFGEVLGGHYGTSMLSSGIARAFDVASELGVPIPFRGRTRLDSGKLLLGQQFEGRLSKPWYLDAEVLANEPDLHEAINADVRASMQRLLRRGVPEDVRLVEAYITEHRGAQYIAQQLMSIRGVLPVAAPFAGTGPLRTASTIATKLKVHNILNRALLRRFAPDLLEYPMAATLVKAKRPIIVQEFSRVARKLLEARTPGTRFGWANFQFLSDRQDFRELGTMLKSDVWDRKNIDRTLQNVTDSRAPGTSLHPLYDMLMKVLTVDLTIGR